MVEPVSVEIAPFQSHFGDTPDKNTNVSMPDPGPEWCYASVAALISSLVSVPLNGFVLLTFLRDRHLQTPFGVYIIVLMISNLGWVIFKQTLDIINSLYYRTWWLGVPLCRMYKYGTYVYSGVILYLHVLITANRICAITFPVAYRNFHSKQMAAILCCVVMVFVNIVSLPPYLLDVIYYAVPVSAGCFINYWEVWNWLFAVQIVIYDFPILFVALAYPWLFSQYQHQRHTDRDRLGTFAKPLTAGTGVPPKRMHKIEAAGSSTGSGYDEQAPAKGKTGKSNDAWRSATSKPVLNAPVKPRRRRVSSRAFMVVSFLTASILICWGPTQIYGTICMFVDLESKAGDEICFVLYVVQSIVDPIAFIFVLRDLRQSVRDRLKRWAGLLRCA